MKIIFAGTSDFAAQALDAIYKANINIALVLTQPDRPAGRGLQLHASPVKEKAQKYSIPVIQPPSLKLDGRYPNEAKETHDILQATPHHIMVVVAYGLILPQSVLQIPPLGCVNIHASLLPRWRGAAPIHRAIQAGDTNTGVTIMQMDAGLDTGPVLLQQSLPILENDTTKSLHDKLAQLGGELIVSALHQLTKGALKETPQALKGISYAEKINKEEAALDFSCSAQDIYNKIRAFNPFPGATIEIDDHRIKVWNAQIVHLSQQGKIGEVLAASPEEGLIVQCKKGIIRLTELQKQGGKRLRDVEFVKGFHIKLRNFLKLVAK
jgi:methionyl-tRNA formyltransferase